MPTKKPTIYECSKHGTRWISPKDKCSKCHPGELPREIVKKPKKKRVIWVTQRNKGLYFLFMSKDRAKTSINGEKDWQIVKFIEA